MKKKLCKISKANIKKHKETILELVTEPKYICDDCLRVSKNKNNLCNAISINNKDH
jgi:hypothetical protein